MPFPTLPTLEPSLPFLVLQPVVGELGWSTLGAGGYEDGKEGTSQMCREVQPIVCFQTLSTHCPLPHPGVRTKKQLRERRRPSGPRLAVRLDRSGASLEDGGWNGVRGCLGKDAHDVLFLPRLAPPHSSQTQKRRRPGEQPFSRKTGRTSGLRVRVCSCCSSGCFLEKTVIPDRGLG